MLDAYIIDAIRQQEQDRQREFEEGRRLWLEIPPPLPRDEHDDEEEAERGVVVIPLYSDDVYEDEAA